MAVLVAFVLAWETLALDDALDVLDAMLAVIILLVQQLQTLFQVLVAVRVDRQGQGLLALECGELLGRQQVVVEVALLQIVGGDKLIIPFC